MLHGQPSPLLRDCGEFPESPVYARELSFRHAKRACPRANGHDRAWACVLVTHADFVMPMPTFRHAHARLSGTTPSLNVGPSAGQNYIMVDYNLIIIEKLLI